MSKYPAEWPEIRERIRKRAGDRCEMCGVHNHAVGYREADGSFCQNRGNITCDASGWGEDEYGNRLTYSQAREFTDHYNDCLVEGHKRLTDDDGNHWIVIVLTLAHLNHDTADNSDENLKMLCQRCHNRHDVQFRKGNRAATRLASRAVASLFGAPAAPGSEGAQP